MAGLFRVEPSGVQGAGGRLADVADDCAGVDLAGPLDSAAGGVGGSSLAGQAGRLAGELSAGVDALAAAVTAMSAAARTAAANYTSADGHASGQFGLLTGGLGGSGWGGGAGADPFGTGTTAGGLFGPPGNAGW